MYSSKGNSGYERYDGMRGHLYPATTRLQSVPPRFYDLVDGSSGRVLASSENNYRNRARSMMRSVRAAEEKEWDHPLYRDLVTGSTAHPGHPYPRSSSEYSQDFICRSRSPSPCPETINNMNRDMIDSINEKLHVSNMRNRFPETFRGQSSTYNQSMGRYQTSYDSPGFRFYRYDNRNDPVRVSHSFVANEGPRFSTRLGEIINVPKPCPDITFLKKRVMGK